MNELKKFTNEKFGDVRTVEIDGVPYFVGKDIACILGYANASKALQDHVDDEDKFNNKSLLSLGQRGGWIVNESGLYSLILSSKLPQAKDFKRWVTREILPSIRKQGAYLTTDTARKVVSDPDFLIKLAEQIKQEQDKNRELKEEVEELQPKVLVAQALESSPDTISIGDFAKILYKNGYETGPNRLFAWMRDNGYLTKSGSSRNHPTQASMEKGLFELDVKPYITANKWRLSSQTRLTVRGQKYFLTKFLCNNSQKQHH